jgi:tRNA(adenine34) deaminase
VTTDDEWMQQALVLALEAEAIGEVPIGAIVVHDGVVVGRAHNRREVDHDPLAHAELLAIKQASQHLGRWRLTGCTLYVTLDPCPMCAGAVINSRLDRVVFGASDVKSRLNHKYSVVSGVLADQSAELLSRFFKSRR